MRIATNVMPISREPVKFDPEEIEEGRSNPPSPVHMDTDSSDSEESTVESRTARSYEQVRFSQCGPSMPGPHLLAPGESKIGSCTTRADEQLSSELYGPSMPGPHLADHVCTPGTASKSNLGRHINLEFIRASSTYHHTGALPTILSPTTAFNFMAEVERGNMGPKVRQMAFDALIYAIKTGKDSIVDYCKAVWLVTQLSDPSFLTQEQCEQMRQLGTLGPFDQDLFSPPELTEDEQRRLLEVLEWRNCNGENGIGSIPWSSLEPVFGNYRNPGKLFRILTDARGNKTPRKVTLSLTEEKDVHPFVVYRRYLKNSYLKPGAVRGHHGFSMLIGKIEISPNLKTKCLQRRIDKLRAENPGLTISDTSPNVQARPLAMKDHEVLLFPNCVDASSYFPLS